jgi:hypothetical protein
MERTQKSGFPAAPSWMSQQQPRDFEKKRARDRRSQQAMRDRTQGTIQNLSDQVRFLARSLEERTREVGILSSRLGVLSTENEHLRIQMATLQLEAERGEEDEENVLLRSPASSVSFRHPWEMPTLNSTPNCIADQLLLDFIHFRRQRNALVFKRHAEKATSYIFKPDINSLLDKQRKVDDEISKVASDVVWSYSEIETLPKQIAVHHLMSVLLNVGY